jgi:hypothetical protein
MAIGGKFSTNGLRRKAARPLRLVWQKRGGDPAFQGVELSFAARPNMC